MTKKSSYSKPLVIVGVAIVVIWYFSMLFLNDTFMRRNGIILAIPFAIGYTTIFFTLFNTEGIFTKIIGIAVTAGILTWFSYLFLSISIVARYGIS